MATTKTFTDVRLQLKYDSYANWSANNPVLLAGEVALTTVPTKSGGVEQVPAVLMKVGDGVTAYNDLKFASALAANVHDWALGESKPVYAATEITGLSDFIGDEIQDTNTTYQIVKVDDYNYKLQSKEKGGAWTDVATNGTVTIPKYDDTQVKADIAALQTLVGTDKVEDQINAAIAALKLAETYDAKGAAATALTDAKAYTDALKNGAVATAQKDIDALEATIGTVAEGKTVVELIKEAQTAATYDDTQVKADIAANASAITTNKADIEAKLSTAQTNLQKSIDANASAIQLLTDGVDPDKVDGVNDLIKYVEEHGTEVTGIKGDIKTNADDIDALEGRATVVEGRMDTAEGEIDDLQAASHTHTNKALLDSYTQTEANLADAVTKKHSHTNATVLNGISSEKVTNWDAAKTGVDKLEATIGTVAEGKTVVELIKEAQTAATYDDTAVRGLIKTNADDIDTLEGRATALETNAVLSGDTLILNCGNSVIA